MKKSKLILSIVLLLAINLSAQPWGETLYSGYGTCSDGTYLSVAGTGFVIGGYYPTGRPNFYIQRTDVGGAHIAPAYWDKEYTVQYNSSSCTTPVSAANDCVGISIIEINPTTDFAVAGATSEGLFYSRLNAGNGAVVNQAFYRFPAGATDITKPLIVQSPLNPDFIICGSYKTLNGGIMYVLNIGSSGAIVNSRGYLVAANLDLIPYDITISPYTPTGVDEVVIVGRAHDISGNAGFAEKGFFLRLDQSDLTVIGTKIYGQVPVPFASGDDHFNAITTAISTTGGSDGFVVSGFSDSLTSGKVWTMKLDRTGNRIYTVIHEPTGDPNAREPVGVIERLFNGTTYSYYVPVESSVGMTVLRLDDFLQPFSAAAPDNYSEFFYNVSTPVASPVAISFNPVAGPDVGIHVFGNDPSSGENYFVEACFNGYEDFATCTSSFYQNTANTYVGPKWEPTVSTTTVTGLTRCLNFSILTSIPSGGITSLCSINTFGPADGSNLRQTSISEQEMEPSIHIFPNPTTGMIKIKGINSSGVIKMTNIIGEQILEFSVNENFDQEIDLKEHSLCPGIYILNYNCGSYSKNFELVLTTE